MCGATDCAASRLDAAVTAATMMSEFATASAADVASRAPIASPACLSVAPSAFGNRMSHAAMVLDAGLAQARGDRLSGFAEADEAEAGCVSKRHLFLDLTGEAQLQAHPRECATALRWQTRAAERMNAATNGEDILCFVVSR